MLAIVLHVIRTEEHIKKDNKWYVFKRLHSNAASFDSHNPLFFKIIDDSNSKLDLEEKIIVQRKRTYNLWSHLYFSLSLFLFSFFLYCFITSDTNYQHLILSFRHVAIKDRFYINFVNNICPRQLS